MIARFDPLIALVFAERRSRVVALFCKRSTIRILTSELA
jgi:hypothetical protein